VINDPLTELALAAAAGDDAALGEVVAATQHKVRRLCAHLGSANDAEDLAQETYLRAMRSLPTYRGEAPFEAWLVQIARYVCADYVRRRVRRSAIDQRYRPTTAGVTAPDHSAELAELVAVLDPDQATALVLTQLVGLSYDEAADVCGCPVGTIRSRVARARARLLEQLDDRFTQLG
jgi:RNA polymerase sigma-70 factor (ECF subfamily)